jgi:fatty-acyl-CoA synthase
VPDPLAAAHDHQLLVKHLFLHPVVDDPEQEIVYRSDRRLRYRELRERVGRLANALERMGVEPGDTVAVMDWDSHRYLEAFFAVPMMGAVLHTINVRLSPEQILYTIEHAEDDVLLVNAEFLPVLEQIRGRIGKVKRFVLLSDGGAAPRTSIPIAGEYEALLAAEEPAREWPDLDEGTRATTFYTTGTTGMPKGVGFSHRQLVLHTLGGLAALGTAPHASFRQGDVYMPITPMFHVHAWGVPYVATALGVKQVYPGKYVPDQLLQLIAREQVTFSHCVPTILHMLLHSPAAAAVDLSRWKVLVGGAAMPRALCLAALRRGIDVVSGYGMSETCPILTVAHLPPAQLSLPPEEQAELRCRTGRAMPLVELRAADEQLREVPRDGRSTGEIVVRAPWLTAGYLKDRAASKRLWAGGWLHTGDVAWRDPRGYVKITDRTKDVIKIGGEWVSSLELEDILMQHPGVAEVAVIGAPDEKWGERPLALVVPRPERKGSLGERELAQHAHGFVEKGLITRQAVLLRVKLVEAIDKTSVGKVNKVALRQRHLG